MRSAAARLWHVQPLRGLVRPLLLPVRSFPSGSFSFLLPAPALNHARLESFGRNDLIVCIRDCRCSPAEPAATSIRTKEAPIPAPNLLPERTTHPRRARAGGAVSSTTTRRRRSSTASSATSAVSVRRHTFSRPQPPRRGSPHAARHACRSNIRTKASDSPRPAPRVARVLSFTPPVALSHTHSHPSLRQAGAKTFSTATAAGAATATASRRTTRRAPLPLSLPAAPIARAPCISCRS